MNKQFLVAWSALLAISISGCTAIAVVGDALECMSGIDCTTDLTDDAINGTNNASKNTTSKYIRGAQINEYRKQSTKSNTNYAHQYAQSNSNSNSCDINTNSEISLKNFSKKKRWCGTASTALCRDSVSAFIEEDYSLGKVELKIIPSHIDGDTLFFKALIRNSSSCNVRVYSAFVEQGNNTEVFVWSFLDLEQYKTASVDKQFTFKKLQAGYLAISGSAKECKI